MIMASFLILCTKIQFLSKTNFTLNIVLCLLQTKLDIEISFKTSPYTSLYDVRMPRWQRRNKTEKRGHVNATHASYAKKGDFPCFSNQETGISYIWLSTMAIPMMQFLFRSAAIIKGCQAIIRKQHKCLFLINFYFFHLKYFISPI